MTTLEQLDLSALLDALRAGDGVDFIRDLTRLVLQELVEAEAARATGAARYERSEGRLTERNGHRTKTVATKAGDLEVKTPKLRRELLPLLPPAPPTHRPGPLRRRDRGLRERGAHPLGRRPRRCFGGHLGHLSQRGLPHLRRARPGGRGLPDAPAQSRPVPLHLPRRDLPAWPLRPSRRLQGRRDRHGRARGRAPRDPRCAVGGPEDELFWRTFLRSRKERGLSGVKLVISDQHAGLVAAIGRCSQGAAHQRCRAHFAENLLACVPKGNQEMVAAAFRTVFAQATSEEMSTQWDQVRTTSSSASRRQLASWTRRRKRCSPSARSHVPSGVSCGARTYWNGSTRS